MSIKYSNLCADIYMASDIPTLASCFFIDGDLDDLGFDYSKFEVVKTSTGIMGIMGIKKDTPKLKIYKEMIVYVSLDNKVLLIPKK